MGGNMQNSAEVIKKFEGGQLEIHEKKGNRTSIFRLGINSIIFLNGGVQIAFTWQGRQVKGAWRKSYRLLSPFFLANQTIGTISTQGDKAVIDHPKAKYFFILAESEECLGKDIINKF